MVGGLKVRVNEDEVEKINKVKKVMPAAENSKRAALGDLQNKGFIRAANKDLLQKDLKETKLPTAIASVKARVDSNLRRVPLAANNNNVITQNINAINNKPAVAPTKAAGKVMTRSSSLRLGTVNGLSEQSALTVNTLQRFCSTRQQNALKTKTLTTKVVESSKLQQVKAVNKAKAVPATRTIASANLRRENSNVIRPSTKTKDIAAATQKPAVNEVKPTAAAKQSTNIFEMKIESNAAFVAKDYSPVVAEVKSEHSHSSRMLEDIEDIDADDKTNMMLVTDYVNDIYDYLYSLEDVFPIHLQHLAGQDEVTANMREVLIDWIVDVHVQFRLAPETLQLGIAIIDRYLQKIKNTKRSYLQLVGVTALFIAAKYEELFPPAIGDFVYITDNTYTMRQILYMEKKIFKTIDFNLSRPLPIHFLRRFSKAARVEDVHHSMSKYFLELSLVDYQTCSWKPSKVAASALFLCLTLLQPTPHGEGLNTNLWTPTLEFYSKYSADDLMPCSKQLAVIAYNAPKQKYKAVYYKYNSSKFQKIALHSQLYGDLMKSIIQKEAKTED